MDNSKAETAPKNHKKIIIALILCAALIICATGIDAVYSSTENSTAFLAMGTVINSKLYGKDSKKIQDEIKKEINVTESSLLSRNIAKSDISRINNNCGKSVSVSKDTANVILDCLNVSADCGGVFDITVGNITRLWDFGGDNQRLPESKEISELLPFVNYKSIIISGNNVTIPNKQSLDLGAVGKGVACDRIKNLLKSTKIKSAVVSVGGSLLIYGKKEFNIGIAKSENDTQSLGKLKLKDTFVSTSGDYEKNFTENGKTYHHILNAKTGYPAESELSSVTVICQSGLYSDALSTACYILGYEKSLPLLKKYDAEAVFVFHNKTVRYTSGVEKIFEITDKSYKVSK